jgi:hypothetical protein
MTNLDPLQQIVQNQNFLKRIEQAFDQTLTHAKQIEANEGAYSLNLNTERLIIFSDHHKGARNRADDFRVTERVYNAALAYYFNMGHTLAVLGDVEELWEEYPQDVLEMYAHTFQLEAQFHQAKRYLRFWGNHDDDWRYADNVRKRLDPLYGGSPLQVREALRAHVKDGTDELGTLFLVHGHQGTLDSDQWATISRPVVRHVIRNWQRLTGYSWNTPATDWMLRETHNLAMYSWASQQPKTVLIVGHTHRPVFASRSHATKIKEQIEIAERTIADPTQRQQAISVLQAELEWVRSQGQQKPGQELPPDLTPKPCYFNSGCCCFVDGKITGLEIAEGEIRLVRWPDPQGKPKPEILERALLREVFAKL